MNYLFVLIVGGIGALLLYITTEFIKSIINIKFSIGILFVNCIGALLIGFLIKFFGNNSMDIKWKLLLITGFLGGYTTFSTYSLETVQYFINGNVKQALMNILLNNILCIFFVLLGMWMNKIIITRIVL
jgi:CrcB protein